MREYNIHDVLDCIYGFAKACQTEFEHRYPTEKSRIIAANKPFDVSEFNIAMKCPRRIVTTSAIYMNIDNLKLLERSDKRWEAETLILEISFSIAGNDEVFYIEAHDSYEMIKERFIKMISQQINDQELFLVEAKNILSDLE